MATWHLDPKHTSVEFSVKHLGVSWVKGRFMDFSADISFDPAQPEQGSVGARLTTASIWTGDDSRDNHLRSADFFDAEHHPEITFRADRIQKTEEGTYEAAGELTMRGVKKPVTLTVQPGEVREMPRDDGTETRMGFTATAKVNRHDYGISWDRPAGAGATTVGEHVDITIHGEAIRE